MAYTDSRREVTGNDFIGAVYTRYPDLPSRAIDSRHGLHPAAAVSWPEIVRRGVLGVGIGRRVHYDGESDGHETADRRTLAHRGGPDVVFVYFGATDKAGRARPCHGPPRPPTTRPSSPRTVTSGACWRCSTPGGPDPARVYGPTSAGPCWSPPWPPRQWRPR
ncbi:hypothetical protein ACWCQP_48590 [Streptomyces chartreusis]